MKNAFSVVAVTAYLLVATVFGTEPSVPLTHETIRVDGIPAGHPDFNRWVAACTMLIEHQRGQADPVTVCGDSGVAFILQADSLHRPFEDQPKQLDIGWWPLDSWGPMLRLDFLSEVNGLSMRTVPSVKAPYRMEAKSLYRDFFRDPIIDGLRSGRPVIAECGSHEIYLVSALDEDDPPLLGQLSCEGEKQVERVSGYPWQVIVCGELGERMDRVTADQEALAFAVKLGRDEVELPRFPGKLSGQKAYQLWLKQLEDPDLTGPHYYHANVVGHLRQNRTHAAAYLRSMAKRHPIEVGEQLLQAADLYEDLVGALTKADTSADGFDRVMLADLLRHAMQLESQAQQHMDQAALLMRSR